MAWGATGNRLKKDFILDEPRKPRARTDPEGPQEKISGSMVASCLEKGDSPI
jgi:hypothetical protein